MSAVSAMTVGAKQQINESRQTVTVFMNSVVILSAAKNLSIYLWARFVKPSLRSG